MALIDLNLGRLGNPIADGLNQIQAARERQKQMDMERAKLMMQQDNQDADNQRANAFLKLQQDQFARTGKNQEEESQRRGAEDYSKIYGAAGHDPEMAKQLAKAYGYDIVDGPGGPVAVQTSKPVGAAPPKFNDSLMTPPGMGSDNGTPQATPGVPSIVPGAGAPIPNAPGASATTDSFPNAAGPAGPTQPAPFDQGAATSISAPPPPQPTQAQVTANADKINPILAAFRMRKGGQEFTVDPNAAKAAADAAFAEQLKLKSAAPEERILATQLENEKKRQFLLDHPELKSQPLTFDEREKLAHIASQGRIGAASIAANAPLRADSGNRQDMSTLRQAFKDWRNENTLNVDSTMNRRLSTALANINSGNPMQQKEAAESLVSVFKGGGQVTKASQDLLLKHLSGIVGDAQTWLQHITTGGYGSRELNVLKQAAQGAMEEQQQRLGAAYKSAIEAFGPGSGFENLGGNVNHAVKGEFKQFGLDVPDIYQSDSAPKVTLGSGSRPKASKGNQIVNARVPKDDKSAIEMAKARLAKNPNDKVAQQVLQQLGAAQ